jgi:DNA-binding transcriptional regulator of glucitol operon
VRQRWFSARALSLHLAVVVWFPGCLVAGWWQVNRAFDGNGLSYLYSVEWPIFALLGVWGWWVLLHADPENVGRRAQEKLAAAAVLADDGPGAAASAAGVPVRNRDEEDEALAAYNDRLAELAAHGPQTWRSR